MKGCGGCKVIRGNQPHLNIPKGKTMKSFLLSTAALIALCVLSTADAEAGGYGFGFSTGGYSYSPASHYVRYTPSYTSWYRSYPAHTWHDTSHWDYHPPTIRRHRDHYHVTPGHWDWHQTGHLHHNHP